MPADTSPLARPGARLRVTPVRLAPRSFRFACEATPYSVRDALDGMEQFLKAGGVAGADRSSLQIVVAEILNNIVEHAYEGRETGRLAMRLFYDPARVFAVFCDAGAPMPENRLPPGGPFNPDCAVTDLPEGGFGWAMIRDLVSDLRYRRVAGQNHLSFRLDRLDRLDRIAEK